MIYLSYILDEHTPTYGNRNKFVAEKKSDISKGDVANDTSITTTVHIGTHIDMPYHFYENGQTIEDFDADFWLFTQPLYVEIEQEELIINEKLIAELKKVNDVGFDILIIKTGLCHKRGQEQFWKLNYGFHPDIYDYIVKKFPNIRVIGFDSISISSWSNRMLGREAHKRFLNPEKPILLLEDMDLRELNKHIFLEEVLVSPIRIAKSDGLPCSVFARICKI